MSTKQGPSLDLMTPVCRIRLRGLSLANIARQLRLVFFVFQIKKEIDCDEMVTSTNHVWREVKLQSIFTSYLIVTLTVVQIPVSYRNKKM